VVWVRVARTSEGASVPDLYVGWTESGTSDFNYGFPVARGSEHRWDPGRISSHVGTGAVTYLVPTNDRLPAPASTGR
jgi:hypothetical protein